MNELVNSLVSQLGVTQSQAQGGAGAIFKAAHERLGAEQFDQLLGSVPGIKDLLIHAPANDGGGLSGGLAGMLGGLASIAGKIGAGDMAQAAQLLSAFSSLGLNKEMAMKFIPIVVQFLESEGGQELVTKVRAALKI